MTILSTPITRACEFAGVPLEVIMNPCKRPAQVRLRWAFWYHLVIVEGWSLPRAARRVNFDHTTVLYGLRRYAADEFGTDVKFTLAQIREAVREMEKAA